MTTPAERSHDDPRPLPQRFRAAIAGEEVHSKPLPLFTDGVVFRHTFEYTVDDFEAEAGFFLAVFGFSTIAPTDDYALFTPSDGAFHVSFWRASEDRLPSSLIGLRMLFMTTDIDAAKQHLTNSGLVADLHETMGSPVQRVLHLTSPSGLPIDIWEDPRLADLRPG